jgi:hypothetical protein
LIKTWKKWLKWWEIIVNWASGRQQKTEQEQRSYDTDYGQRPKHEKMVLKNVNGRQNIKREGLCSDNLERLWMWSSGEGGVTCGETWVFSMPHKQKAKISDEKVQSLKQLKCFCSLMY